MKFKRYENKFITIIIDLDEISSIVCNYNTTHGLMTVLYKSNSTKLDFRCNIEDMKEIEKDISGYLLNKIEV